MNGQPMKPCFYSILKIFQNALEMFPYFKMGLLANKSPGPMSKIRSDFRVGARGFICKIRVRGVARIRGDMSKTSGSDS